MPSKLKIYFDNINLTYTQWLGFESRFVSQQLGMATKENHFYL